jgi:hypothetical protein
MTRSIVVLLQAVRRDELLIRRLSLRIIRVHVLSLRTSPRCPTLNGIDRSTRLRLSKRPFSACSNAAVAVALPLLESCQPRNSRVRHPLTSAKVYQPSRPRQNAAKMRRPALFRLRYHRTRLSLSFCLRNSRTSNSSTPPYSFLYRK